MPREKHLFATITLYAFGGIALVIGIYLTATHTTATSLVVGSRMGYMSQGTVTGPACLVFATLFFVVGYLNHRQDRRALIDDAEIEKEEQEELKKLENE